nr:immunoglobulin light chain junction region [Macaca mulatta]MOV63754.1 immunoglobulin light chain junction region [Macaca mulatta]MOV64000.1 immunoglobulin light chain junction region [Macaca mulatta]
CQQYNRFPPTF